MIKMRKATPEDASFLADAILIAGRAHVKRGIWEVILGGTEEQCLRFLCNLSITDIQHLFHHSHYLIAEEYGLPVGSLGGYDAKKSGYQALRQAIPEVARKLNLSPQAMNASAERAARILSCLPKEIAGAWVIDSVATLPSHRGKGVAGELLKHILEEGKDHGYSKAQVNMYIGNIPALNLYLKYGFELVEEIRDGYFERHIGSPGMISLVKDL